MKYNEYPELTALKDDDILLIQEASTLGIKKVKLSTLKQYIGVVPETPKPASDPNFASVALLIHMDGANGSTVFTDVKGKSIISAGNIAISTAQSKFGGASAYFDGNYSYLLLPHSTDFNLEASDFTIESFVRFNSVSGQQTFLGKWQGSYPNNVEWLCLKNSSGGLEIALYNSDNTQTNFATNWSPVVNQWYCICFVRYGNQILLFIDGILLQSFDYFKAVKTTNAAIWIGGEQALNANWFNGYIDELRISKGIARYTSNYTVTTSAYPNK